MTIRKIMLLGEMAVGKTSIVTRLVFDRFEHSYKSTIGTDVYRYDVEPAPGGEPFQFLVWDTDGSYEDAMVRTDHFGGPRPPSSSAISRVPEHLTRRCGWRTCFPMPCQAATLPPFSTSRT